MESVIELFIEKYGSRYHEEIYDLDGTPYVNFIVNGNMVKGDFKLQESGELWIYPPIGGG